MKEIPILMSTPMVRAMLDGRKTQTRRIVVKNNSTCGSLLTGDGQGWHSFDFNDVVVDGKNSDCQYLKVAVPENDTRHRIFPKRSVGDILWVREMFFYNGDEVVYRANGTCCEQFEQCECNEVGKPKWRPSIHMPKDAARIWLQVKSIRVERLHDITEADAISEGIERNDIGYKNYNDVHDVSAIIGDNAAVRSFQSLWCKINGSPHWNSNPFVWVIEFEVISCDGRPSDFLGSFPALQSAAATSRKKTPDTCKK